MGGEACLIVSGGPLPGLTAWCLQSSPFISRTSHPRSGNSLKPVGVRILDPHRPKPEGHGYRLSPGACLEPSR